jgi:hypothetical protein
MYREKESTPVHVEKPIIVERKVPDLVVESSKKEVIELRHSLQKALAEIVIPNKCLYYILGSREEDQS